jgi:hypothetical protein
MGGFANNAPIVTDGLVFYVDAGNSKSYPGSGTTWYDMISGNVGTLYNGPTFDSANGGSIDFDGSNDRTDFPTDSSFKPTGSMTLLVWAKGQTGASSVGLAGTLGASGNRGYLIGCNLSDFRFSIASNSTTLVNVFATHTDTTSAPFMLTGVYSASTHLKMYKNTSEIASNTTSIPATQYVGTKPFQIGNRGDSFSNSFWNGNVYCAMVYNKALSADEITQNYNALKNRFV